MKKDVLHRKIRDLKLRSCPEEIWNEIENTLDNDLFRSHSSSLKEKKAANGIWKRIEAELDYREELDQLERKAPELLWESIEKDLPIERKVFPLRTWMSGAAIIALLWSIWWIQKPNEEIVISEVEMPRQTNMEWSEEDASWELILKEACDQQPFACHSERFKTLEEELKFLTLSKKEVLEQLNPYEENQQVNKILTDIELERIEVIKAMIQETLS